MMLYIWLGYAVMALTCYVYGWVVYLHATIQDDKTWVAELNSASIRQLKKSAQHYHVKGYSYMNKTQLVGALTCVK